MASSVQPRVKAAHVNMMTDTIIKNLPADGLRVIVRSLLAAHPEITGSFEAETQKYIKETALPAASRAGSRADVQWLESTRSTIRCMVGCGFCYQALPLAGELARNALGLSLEGSEDEKSWTSNSLPSIDGDIVQAATAVQKTLMTPSGVRNPTEDELQLIRDLHNVLIDGQQAATQASIEYPYSRALAATSSLLGLPIGENRDQTVELGEIGEAPLSPLETFALSGRKLPRVFSGLWQLSSPAWGSAPTSKILSQFATHVRSGFTAFDMADHYGDAELIFGRFRSAYPHKEQLFAATKYCVFHPLTVTREAVQANVTERCQRLQTQRIDLLQFHWQLYNDPQYLDALHYLAEDDRVGSLGLCNFDTEHMEKVIRSGVTICSNQVQFSLIDSRPTIRMGELCQKHDIKLLTYGTLCGGFLAEKWLGVAEPDLYDELITPSQRKVTIGAKHKVSISNVATRWVLDFPYVGAVIVGARMGISEHTEENMASLGWSLDDEDREAVEQLLQKSRRHEMFEAMGDCGGEYR
ncbi:hypothetical protein PG989_004031 [Apiospora arundinis]